MIVHAGEMSSALKYAALFWVSHLTMDLHIQDLRQSMRKFFEEHLLNWIRVCATTNHLPECMMSLGQLRKSLEKLRGLKTQNIVSRFESTFYLSTDTASRPMTISNGAAILSTSCARIKLFCKHPPKLYTPLQSCSLLPIILFAEIINLASKLNYLQ